MTAPAIVSAPADGRHHRRRLARLGLALWLAGAAVAGADDWRERDVILARIVAPSFPARDFPVTDYGAKGDGTTDCRAAIAGAVAACSAAGGGRVVVPAGNFFCDGPVHLRSGVNLHLAAGATLRFGAATERYLPAVLTRFEGTMLLGHSPRIYAHGAVDVAITGAGVIDGNGRATLELMRDRPRGGSGELRRMGAEGLPVDRRVFGEGRWMRPSMIQFLECTNVLIEGVTIRDSTFWIVHPVLCRNVTVRGLTIQSMNGNNDGVDPDSSADVLIEDCVFDTGDDAVAIKSGRDQDGWRVGRPSENIVIRRCTMRSRHSGLCIGSEMSGGVRNVFMEDCTLSSVSSAFYFKANLDRGGEVRHVRARRITAERVREGFVRFETGYHGYRGGDFPPSFRDFVIEDISCAQADAYGLYIEGVPAAPVRDVTVRRATLGGAKAAYWLKHFEGLRLEQVKINGRDLPPEPPPTPAGEVKLKISS
jgi:polygalacturonase